MQQFGLPASKPKPKRPRDFQRSKVYRWERACVHHLLDHEVLSLDECRSLVEEVYLWHDQPTKIDGWSPPIVSDGRGRKHACGSRDVIKLPRWARHRTIVLHECAHGMTNDGHGPEFVACYIRLLGRYVSMNEMDLCRSAHAAGLRVARSDQIKAAHSGMKVSG